MTFSMMAVNFCLHTECVPSHKRKHVGVDKQKVVGSLNDCWNIFL